MKYFTVFLFLLALVVVAQTDPSPTLSPIPSPTNPPVTEKTSKTVVITETKTQIIDPSPVVVTSTKILDDLPTPTKPKPEPTASPSLPSAPSESSSNDTTMTVVWIVVGLGIAVIVIGGTAFMLRKYRRKRDETAFPDALDDFSGLPMSRPIIANAPTNPDHGSFRNHESEAVFLKQLNEP